MSYRSLFAALLRLAGVVILVSAVAGIPSTFFSLLTYKGTDFSIGELVFFSVAGAAVPVLLGLLLIVMPGTIASPLSSEPQEPPSDARLVNQLQTVAFSVLGLYFIAQSLSSAVYYFSRLKLYFDVIGPSDAVPNMPIMLPDDFGGIAFVVIQFIVGIGLFLGARGLSGVLSRLRGHDDR